MLIYSTSNYILYYYNILCHHVFECIINIIIVFFYFSTGDRLEILYAPIRYKLGNALANWHPSDVSAKIILEPWVGVFRQGHMDAFLVKHILTKLAVIVEDMPISPHQQNLG